MLYYTITADDCVIFAINQKYAIISTDTSVYVSKYSFLNQYKKHIRFIYQPWSREAKRIAKIFGSFKIC